VLLTDIEADKGRFLAPLRPTLDNARFLAPSALSDVLATVNGLVEGGALTGRVLARLLGAHSVPLPHTRGSHVVHGSPAAGSSGVEDSQVVVTDGDRLQMKPIVTVSAPACSLVPAMVSLLHAIIVNYL
jgi:hypothetical protein